MSLWRERLRQLWRYPSAVVGLAMIAALIAVSIYTIIAIPYGQALDLWRGGEAWRLHPVNAGPVWVDRLLGGDLPRTQVVRSRNAQREHRRPAEREGLAHRPVVEPPVHGGVPREHQRDPHEDEVQERRRRECGHHSVGPLVRRPPAEAQSEELSHGQEHVAGDPRADPSRDHRRAQGGAERREHHGGHAFGAPLDVVLSERRRYTPPATRFLAEHLDNLGDDGKVHGPPDIVVEVSSPATRARDLTTKRDAYAEFGVPEYWFVDLDARAVVVHRLAGRGYPQPDIVDHRGTLTSPLLEGFALAVADLLADVPTDPAR
jgi:hypothetical protein